MKPSDFKYYRANSLDHALDILNSEENYRFLVSLSHEKKLPK